MRVSNETRAFWSSLQRPPLRALDLRRQAPQAPVPVRGLTRIVDVVGRVHEILTRGLRQVLQDPSAMLRLFRRASWTANGRNGKELLKDRHPFRARFHQDRRLALEPRGSSERRYAATLNTIAASTKVTARRVLRR